MFRRTLVFITLMIAVQDSYSDSIRIGDEEFRNVYIIKSAGFYQILFPETGESTRVSAQRADVSVELTKDRGDRDALKRDWEAKKAITDNDKVEESTDPKNSRKPSREKLADYEARQARLELAAFEAAFEVWQSLDETQRMAVISGIAAEGDSYISEKLNKAGSLAAKREILGNLQESVDSVAELADTLAEARKAEELENPSLKWNRKMLESTLIRQTAQDLTGNHNPHTKTTALKYKLEYEADLAKTQQKVNAIEMARKTTRENAQRKITEIENSKQRLSAEQSHLQMTAADRSVRTRNTLMFLSRLELAIADGYSQRIEYSPIQEAINTDKPWEATFEASGDFARIR